MLSPSAFLLLKLQQLWFHEHVDMPGKQAFCLQALYLLRGDQEFWDQPSDCTPSTQDRKLKAESQSDPQQTDKPKDGSRNRNAAFPTPTKQRTPTSLIQIVHTHSVIDENVCSVVLSIQFNSATVTGISPKEEKNHCCFQHCINWICSRQGYRW